MGGELGGRNHSGTQEEIREFSASLVQLSLVVRAHTHTHTHISPRSWNTHGQVQSPYDTFQ